MKINGLRKGLVRGCFFCGLVCLLSLSLIACAEKELIETTPVENGRTDGQAQTSRIPANTSVTSTNTSESAPGTTTAPVTTDPLPKDTTPPLVTGEDFELIMGNSVSYRSKITVTDDTDSNPTISIDNSAVDLDTEGVYPIVYTVTDASGNSTVFTLHMTVIKELTAAPTEQYVLHQANEILSDIVDDSMSDLQVAYTIYRWTKNNIAYYDSSDKTDWLVGAYDGFRKRRGDCYTYYAVSKALLTAAGIDNVDMIKHRTSDKQSRHYWLLVNVGEGWYHFDTTRYSFKNDNFFMVTDAELAAWDAKYYKGAHNFIDEGLPERATESIQDRVNYNSATLKY